MIRRVLLLAAISVARALQLTVGIDFFNRHLVHSQSTCLSDAMISVEPKRFNRWQFTDDGIPFCKGCSSQR